MSPALLHRIVLGNMVIDHERITRTFPEGPGGGIADDPATVTKCAREQLALGASQLKLMAGDATFAVSILPLN